MSKKLIRLTTLFMLLGCTHPYAAAQSIEEKKANLHGSESDLDHETEQYLIKINKDIQNLNVHIQQLYDEVLQLYRSEAPPEQYRALLSEINDYKNQLHTMENRWRELVSKNTQGEEYGLWHAPETNLEQLIIDYGSQDYVYLIPPEVGSIKMSIDSNLPIPRSSWKEMLDLILQQNGVGIRSLNPYLRQLYLVKEDNSNLRLVTNNCQDLEVLPSDARVGFFLSPEPSEGSVAYFSLEKFMNPNTTTLQKLGKNILIIGRVADIKDLLRIYHFVILNKGDKDYRLIPLYKTTPEEMAKILATIFDQQENSGSSEVQTGFNNGSESNGLKIVVLQNMAQALFIVGTREEVRKAEEIVHNVESQIGGARDREVYWYTVKHSNAEELADVLYRVYMLMISSGAGVDEGAGGINGGGSPLNGGPELAIGPNGSSGYIPEPGGGLLINPKPVEPGTFVQTDPNNTRGNFIVDLKTGSIVMVVEGDILPKMKELIARLDVPKKMVQIEVLLFEKVFKRDNSFGLNILRIGEHIAKNRNLTGMVFNTLGNHQNNDNQPPRGISEFFLSRKKTDSGLPPFDLAYRFLLSQDDVQINDSPSILTMNQTPATISIVDEISLNNGFSYGGGGSGSGPGNGWGGDQFTRQQYGIVISIKPTIHTRDENADTNTDYDYVTLETDIVFDTFQRGENPSQPDVIRRKIKNEVDVVDNETVILGGLRKKMTNDNKEGIPFVGELPGIGKLFSLTNMKDSNTEMFIFITPHIIKDPKDQLACLRQELLSLRPGDVPYFLECVDQAHRCQKERLMEGSMTMLFGRPNPRYYYPDLDCCDTGEYDDNE